MIFFFRWINKIEGYTYENSAESQLYTRVKNSQKILRYKNQERKPRRQPRPNSINSAVEYRVSRIRGTLSGLFTSMQDPEQNPPLPCSLSSLFHVPSTSSQKPSPISSLHSVLLSATARRLNILRKGVMYCLLKCS